MFALIRSTADPSPGLESASNGPRWSSALLGPAMGSALLHAAVGVVLLVAPAPAPRPPQMPIGMVELADLPKQPPPPMPQPEPAPQPPKAAEPRPSKPAAPPPKAPPPPPPAPGETPPATPVRLTGVQLSNGGTLTITGIAERDQPAAAQPRRSAGVATSQPVAPSPKPLAVRTGPKLVQAADLSTRPKPPNLNAELRRHYPSRLRQLGVEGEALVRALISPTGRVDKTTLLFESHAGFGGACLNTLRQSHWSPPITSDGTAAATFVKYRCRFKIDQ